MKIGRGKSKRHQKTIIPNDTITTRYENNLTISVVPGGQVVGGSIAHTITRNIS